MNNGNSFRILLALLFAVVSSCSSPSKESSTKPTEYILNKSTKEIHTASCSYVSMMAEHNKEVIGSSELDTYLDWGYDGCYYCFNSEHYK